jgi:hypothetical protein
MKIKQKILQKTVGGLLTALVFAGISPAIDYLKYKADCSLVPTLSTEQCEQDNQDLGQRSFLDFLENVTNEIAEKLLMDTVRAPIDPPQRRKKDFPKSDNNHPKE